MGTTREGDAAAAFNFCFAASAAAAFFAASAAAAFSAAAVQIRTNSSSSSSPSSFTSPTPRNKQSIVAAVNVQAWCVGGEREMVRPPAGTLAVVRR